MESYQPPLIHATTTRRAFTKQIEATLQISTSVEDCVETLVHKLSLIKYRQGFLSSKYGYGFPPNPEGLFNSFNVAGRVLVVQKAAKSCRQDLV